MGLNGIGLTGPGSVADGIRKTRSALRTKLTGPGSVSAQIKGSKVVSSLPRLKRAPIGEIRGTRGTVDALDFAEVDNPDGVL